MSYGNDFIDLNRGPLLRRPVLLTIIIYTNVSAVLFNLHWTLVVYSMTLLVSEAYYCVVE